jgi:hypothetical protein
MAGSRDLTYSVGVDASDAVGGLKKLEGAVKSTMSEVESELDEGASSGDKFKESVDRLSIQLKEDFDKAALAAGELQRALKEVDSELEVGDAISELLRMGITFDEIRADADLFAQSLKQLDDVRLEGVKELDAVAPGLATKLDQVGKSADSSKSVLANMVGNASQDLGALGGIAGSAGVAIGQMGEYMADAAFSGEGMKSVVKSFAAVAGPVAALSAGIFLVTSAVEAFSAPGKAAAERTKELGEAMQNTGDDSIAFADVLRENAGALEDFIADSNDPLGSFGTAVDEIGSKIPIIGSNFKEAGVNVIDAADRAGLSIYDLGKQIAGTGLTTEEFEAQLQAAKDAGKITGEEMNAVEEAMKEYGDSAAQAAKDTGLFNIDAEEATAIVKDLATQKDPIGAFASEFGQLMDDMRDGSVDTESAATAINSLAKELGLTQAEVIALAQEELDEEMKDAEEATDGAASAADRHTAALERQTAMTDNARVANEKLRGDINTREAYLNLEGTFADLETAGTEAMTAVHDGTVTAEEATRGFELQQLAAKEEVLDYVDAIGEIPAEKETEILSLINQGEYDAAMEQLRLLTAPREMEIRFKFDVGKLNELNRLVPGGIGVAPGSTKRLTGVRD